MSTRDPTVDAPLAGSDEAFSLAGGLQRAERVPDLQLGIAQEQVRSALFGVRLAEHRIDRFTLLEPIGRGGMGEVFAAYDPQLDRRVAIKLVSTARRSRDARGHDELLAEGRAMARVSHPNVVSVFEVGLHVPSDGEPSVFVAMEFVRGKTLRAWVRETKPGWRRIVDAYVAAGRGLAAVHGAGLVHRDFKPDNAMIDDDGHVRVMDFGLARELDVVHGRDVTPVEIAEMIEERTRSGVLAGTPAYMAPEQLRGGRLDHRTDQFALCVSLYEALWGRRPWDGPSIIAYTKLVLEGVAPAAPPRSPVPVRIRQAILRGLSARPADRWPSMHALLHALGVSSSRAWRWIGVGTSLAAAAGLAAWGYTRHERSQRIAACEASGDEIETAWNDERRDALRAALRGTGRSYAAATADAVVPWLDEQARQWREARVETCLDVDVRARWNADMLERSVWCLDERRMQLEALVDELTAPDDVVLQKAVSAAAGLTPVSPCRDEAVLQAMKLPSPEEREAVRAVLADVTRVDALQRAGHFDEALERGREALGRAETLQWPPLVASAQYHVGRLLQHKGKYADAEAMLEDAYFTAAGGVEPEVLVGAATRLVYVVSKDLGRPDDGLRWRRHAEVGLASIHDEGGLRRASLLSNLGTVHEVAGRLDEATASLVEAIAIKEAVLGAEHPDLAASYQILSSFHNTMGRYDEAKALAERVLLVRERTLGPDHPDVGTSLGNLANIHHATGALPEARALHERALAIFEGAMGPEHPYVAGTLVNLANVHYDAGDYEQAKALDERALAIFEKALGPDHPRVAATASNLANAHMMLGEYDEVKALQERAVAVLEKALGPDHPHVAQALHNLGGALANLGSHAEAVPLFERALALRERALGPEHPRVADTLDSLAVALVATGAYEQAERHYERASSIMERALGPDHPDVARPLEGLAELALARGRPSDAVPLAQRAVTLREAAGAPYLLASARFVLARALWEAPPGRGRDRARARELAEQAREAIERTGPGPTGKLAKIEHWLAEHRGSGTDAARPARDDDAVSGDER